MAEIRHPWLTKYFEERPQLPRPAHLMFGYSIPPQWHGVVDKLLSERNHDLREELEKARVEIGQLRKALTEIAESSHDEGIVLADIAQAALSTKDTNPYAELSRIVDEHKKKYRPQADPDYPEYENISAFIDDVLKAAGVTEVVDMDGHTAAELLVMSIRRQSEKDK